MFKVSLTKPAWFYTKPRDWPTGELDERAGERVFPIKWPVSVCMYVGLKQHREREKEGVCSLEMSTHICWWAIIKRGMTNVVKCWSGLFFFPSTWKTAQNKCLHFSSINLFHPFPTASKTSCNNQVIVPCALFHSKSIWKTFFFLQGCTSKQQTKNNFTGAHGERRKKSRSRFLFLSRVQVRTKTCVGSSGKTYRSARCWRCGVKRSRTEDCGSSPAITPPEA